MPKRERYVWVCINRRADGHPKGSCAEKGSEKLHAELKNAVGEAGIHRRVRVMTSSCTDLCWKGIAVTVMPDNAWLGGVTSADVPALVTALGSPGGPSASEALRAKIVRDREFDEPKPVGDAAPGRNS